VRCLVRCNRKSAKLKQKIEVVRKKGKNREKKVFEKWEMISSPTYRRSFCTNIYPVYPVWISDGGTDADFGTQKPGSFHRYIKVDNQQAAKRLKELRAKLVK
jgi:hypothetical protein